MNIIKGYIFDLDGVVINTAPQHFQAWKKLASDLGFELNENVENSLRGVSRLDALEVVLKSGGVVIPDNKKAILAIRKNEYYREMISKLTVDDILPGVKDFLNYLHIKGRKTALATVSKNAATILNALNLGESFDYIVDGMKIKKGKPDPEVFLKAAKGIELDPVDCVVFEDALAGIQAAKAAGMRNVGVGNITLKGVADYFVESFEIVGDISDLLL